jgi:hypothetical protein
LSFTALEFSREEIKKSNQELQEAELEAVLFAQQKVRERLAN